MISKQDCLLLLTELNLKDVDCDKYITDLLCMETPSFEIISFINSHMKLDLNNFYNKIRRSYNQKKSKLYINIVKEIEDTNEVLTTLSAMLTQILLFAKTAENKEIFLRQSRADEITQVLNNYFNTYDITNCLKLLRLIKADVCVCEYMDGKRK